MSSYWIIEAMGPKYWNGEKFDRTGFTPKHNDAVRFARFNDAEKVRCWLFPTDIECLIKSVEHAEIKP